MPVPSAMPQGLGVLCVQRVPTIDALHGAGSSSYLDVGTMICGDRGTPAPPSQFSPLRDSSNTIGKKRNLEIENALCATVFRGRDFFQSPTQVVNGSKCVSSTAYCDRLDSRPTKRQRRTVRESRQLGLGKKVFETQAPVSGTFPSRQGPCSLKLKRSYDVYCGNLASKRVCRENAFKCTSSAVTAASGVTAATRGGIIESPNTHCTTRLPAAAAQVTALSLRSLEGRIIGGKYLVHEQVGRGTNTVIHRGTVLGSLQPPVALKIMDLSCDSRHSPARSLSQCLEAECAALRMLAGIPTVVRIIDAVSAVDGRYGVLVLEFVEGGNLLEVLQNNIGPHGRLSEMASSSLIARVVHSLSICHRKGVVHLDIKPENLLFASHSPMAESLKLADFGLAMQLNGKTSINVDRYIGSPCYMAPELIICKPSCVSLTSDMWSVGVVAYLMLTGRLPFPECGYLHPDGRIVQSRAWSKREEFKSLSRCAQHFVERCLCIDWQSRITAEQALRHPWVAESVAQYATHGPVPRDKNIHHRKLSVDYL